MDNLSNEQLAEQIAQLQAVLTQRTKQEEYEKYLADFSQAENQRRLDWEDTLQATADKWVAEDVGLFKKQGGKTTTYRITHAGVLDLVRRVSVGELTAPEGYEPKDPTPFEDFKKPRAPPCKKEKKAGGGAKKSGGKVKDPDEIYTGPPACLCRTGRTFCGAPGAWLCEEHIGQYSKGKKLKTGWWGCFGDNTWEGGKWGQRHDDYMSKHARTHMETKDNRPEECKAEYPLY